MSAGSFTRNLHVLEKGPNTRFLVSKLGRFGQPDSIVPGAANPQNLNRYSYVGNNPVGFVDPSGHARICLDAFGCRDETDKGIIDTGAPVIGVPSSENKDQGIREDIPEEDIFRIALVIWAESSGGKMPDEWERIMAWTRFNKFAFDGVYTTGAITMIARQFGYPGRGSVLPFLDKAIGCLLDPNQCPVGHDSFVAVLDLVLGEYANWTEGASDPSNGGLFFVHLDEDNIGNQAGVHFSTIEEGRDAVVSGAGEMQQNFRYEHALSQGVPYSFPFTFGVTEITDIPTIGPKFMFYGNHYCVYAVNCGSGFVGP